MTDHAELLRRVWLLLEHNRLKEAIQICTKLNHEFPNSAGGWHVASHLAHRLRKFGKALEYVECAINLGGKNPTFPNQKAKCFHSLNRREEALSLTNDLSAVQLSEAKHYALLGDLQTIQARYE